MANDVGVRSYLQGKGIDNNDIGYDSNSGYVQVKGQNFLKPAANFSGTTYDSQPNLDNAYKMYSQPKVQADPNGYGMNQVGTAGANVAASNPGNPIPQKQTIPQYSNPYTQQIAELMKHLSDQSAGLSQPVDPYSSPQYAAAQAQQQKNAQLATRAAQESMGQSGFARSTNLADRSQHIQNDANDYITTQVVPQIIATLQAQKQQELQNTQSQFNNVYNLSNQEDSRHQNDINNLYKEAEATGYLNTTGKTVDDLQREMDANSKAYATATPEQQKVLHDNNIQIAQLLGKTYDPQTGSYSQGSGYVGRQTIQGKTADIVNQGNQLTNKLNQLKLDDYPAEQKANATKIQQDLEAGQITNETAKFKLDQLKDPESPINQAQKLELQMKQLEADNLPEKQQLELQQLRKTIEQIGVVHYKPQTEAEIAQDKVTIATANQQLKDIESGKVPLTKGQTAEGYASYVDGVAKYDNGNNSDNGAKQLTNPVDVEKSILQSGLPESEMRKLYTRFGLNWGE